MLSLAPTGASALLLGLDFTSAPSARKPLTLAFGRRAGAVLRLDRVDELATHAELEALIATGHIGPLQGGFVMGCDFPFGLPRPFVEALTQHGPGVLPTLLRAPLDSASQANPCHSEAQRLSQALHTHCGDRAGFQRLVDGWGSDAEHGWQPDRPPGSKLIHRVCDRAVPGLSSTSPLQTRYVPVGKMYFEGLSRLLAAGLTLPGLHPGRPDAIALEAYPGLLAGEVLGKRSYKSDAKADTAATHNRLIARMDLVDALEQGRTRLGLRLKLSPAQRDHLVADAKGDRLDAVLCLLQAAWAQRRFEEGDARFGLPEGVDPVEGWILTA
ncbi:DUF429 domain-containing protein [Aquabacterium sp.]|uniref:DUF429 domain-containing protein n=1 Tax=Aquabacterium sp. TaxID=1872578 RepID=UPI0025C6E0CE|nr:DUF429 domain-containing protein [Aquabacterium sp.]